MAWNQSSNCIKHPGEQPRQRALNTTGRYLAIGITLGIAMSVFCYLFVESENKPDKTSCCVTKEHQTISLSAEGNLDSEKSVTSTVVTNGSRAVDHNSLSNSFTNTKTVPNVDRWGVPKHKRRFDTGTEYILARIFSTKLGHPPPPVPSLPRREMNNLEDILSRPTQILPDDSQSVREMKQYCDLAKKEFKKFKEEGGDASEFLDYYKTKLKDYYNQWLDAQKIVHETAESGDVEGAKRMADEINKRNAERGIRFVTVTE